MPACLIFPSIHAAGAIYMHVQATEQTSTKYKMLVFYNKYMQNKQIKYRQPESS